MAFVPIIIPMPYSDNDDKASILDNDLRYYMAVGEGSLKSKIQELDEEKERILQVLKDNEQIRKMLLSGELLEDIKEENQISEKSYKKYIIATIIAVVVGAATFINPFDMDLSVWNIIRFVISTGGFLTGLITGLMSIFTYRDYKRQLRACKEYEFLFGDEEEKELEKEKTLSETHEEKRELENTKELTTYETKTYDYDYFKQMDILLRQRYALSKTEEEKNEIAQKITKNYSDMASSLKQEKEKKLILK